MENWALPFARIDIDDFFNFTVVNVKYPAVKMW
jgi:hypothetical protein